MEQQIRFCTTSDGVRIAYAIAGEGSPLVLVNPWVGHLQLDWSHPEASAFYQGLAQGHQLVRFDRRGTGLSDRDVDDFSLDARLRDLEAVLAAAAIERFAIMGFSESGPTVLKFAAAHPDRLTHVVLCASFPRWAFLGESVGEFRTRLQPLLALIRAEWGMASAAITAAMVPSGEPSWVNYWTELQRQSTSGETAASMYEASLEVDAEDVLAELATPTLIVHRRGDPLVPFEGAREMAIRLPNARLEALEGNVHPPMFGNSGEVVAAIQRFLGATEPTEQRQQTSGTAVILFTDIVDSTALTERLGDARFREMSGALDMALRAAIRTAGGAPIDGKLLGDGVLATFPSAAQAIDGAQRCLALSAASELGLHIGLHAGDVIREDNNVYGGAVNIAARICALSRPGELLVSDTVRALARTSAGVTFEDRGEHSLKGIEDGQRVFAIRVGNS